MSNTISSDAYDRYLEKKRKSTSVANTTKDYDLSTAGENILKGLLPGNTTSFVKGIEKATGADLSGLQKAAAVADFVPAKLDAGFLGAAEGITDFLAGGATQLVGQKDAAKWIYEHSWSRDLSGSAAVDEELDKGANGYRIASDVLSGIGNVGFQVGIGLATGGLAQAGALSQTAARAITMGTLFIEGAGSGTAEAVRKTGNVGWKENVAGLGSGAIEVATEMISPTGQMIRTAITGKTVKEGAKYLAKNAVAKNIARNFFGEYLEESTSYMLNWALQNQVLKIDDSPFSWKEWFYEGVMGGIAGSIFASPTDIMTIRNAQRAGAEVYAQGEEAVKAKINEGKVELQTMKEAGLDQDPRFKTGYQIAEQALAELETNDKLTNKQKSLYLGLAEQSVMNIEMTQYAANIAEFNAEQAKQGLVDTQRLADSLNAVVREAGGESNFKADDFLDKNSYANRLRAITEMFTTIIDPTVEVQAARSIMQQRAQRFTGDAEQVQAIKGLADGQVLTFNIGNGAYAIVTKRGGSDTYSLAYASAKSVANGKGVFALHELSLDKVIDYAGASLNGAEVDSMIETAEQGEADAEELRIQQEILREAGIEEESAPEAEQSTRTAQTEQNNDATPEDLTEVERRLVPDLGIDRSSFTREEWIEARKYVPNIDTLSKTQKARILTLIRTGNAMGINKTYLKGLVRISAAYNVGILFTDQMPAKGFELPTARGAYVVINPGDINTTHGHELFHTFAKGADGKTRSDLVDRVRRIVGAKAYDTAKEQYKRDYLAQFGENVSAEVLDEEAAASVIGNYLSNMSLLRKIASRDEWLGRRLLTAVRGMKDKWTSAKAFAKENDSTAFAEYRRIGQIERLLMKELGYGQSQKAKNGSLIEYTDENGTVSYNVRTYRTQEIQADGTKKSGREILEQSLRKRGYSDKSITSFLTQLDTIADQMERFGQRYPLQNNWNNTNLSYNDETKELVFSALVNNGEYALNLDFSTVCKHREAFTTVLNKLVSLGKGGQINLTPKKIAQINTILKEHGFETACKMCFVEGKRNNIKNWATAFVEGKGGKSQQKGWNEIVRSIYGKNAKYANFGMAEATDDDIFANGQNIEADLAAVKKLDATIEARLKEGKKENTEAKLINLIKSDNRYAFLMKPENLYGTKGVSVIKEKYPEMYSILLQSYGVATPKVTLPAAPYASEMLSDRIGSTGKKDLAEYTFSIGGARLQSFSDFQMIRFLDYCQLIADGASVGVAMQSYTKEIDFVHLFGLTGMKINMSIVPGVDASANKNYMDGDYVGLIRKADGSFDYYFATESIQLYDSYDEKGNLIRHGAFWYQNQDGYRENVGTILIGVSKYQILKAMADPDIRMVIPYHKSGLNATMAELLGISGFTDYTEFQHTRKQNAEGKWVAVSKSEEFDFYEAYRRNNGDAKQACQEYIEYCEKNGFRPKFYEPGTKYEGIVYGKNGKMNPNYYKLIEDFSCYADGKNKIAQQRAIELTLPYDWSERVELGLSEAQETATRLDSTLDSIIDEVLAAKDRETNAQIAKRQMVAEEQSQKPGMRKTDGVSYSPASVSRETDARYLELARDPQKNESELRRLVKEAAEKAGFPVRTLHGTQAFGFTTMDVQKSDDKRTVFATDSEDTAETYSSVPGIRRLTEEANWDVIEDRVNELESEARSAAYSLAERISAFAGYRDAVYGEDLYDDFARIARDGDEKSNTGTADGDMYERAEEWISEQYDEDAYNGMEYIEWCETSEAETLFTKVNETIEYFLNLASYEKKSELSGNMELFANTDGFFVIDGNGRNWDKLVSDQLPDITSVEGKKYGYRGHWTEWTTRSVCAWAYDNGYKGVAFKNIIDNGGKANKRVDPSNVYAFFDPKAQLKSADPVTYDDSGNIIPLSERFNPQNDDIRYSPASYGGKSGRYVAQSQPARQTIREKITNKAGQLNRQGFRNALKEGGSVVEGFKIGFVNAQQAVENQLVRAGMTKREAAAVIQYARTGRSHAFNAAQYKLADMTGEIRSEGLLKIIEPFLATKGEVFDAVDPKTGETVPAVAKGGEMGGRKYIDFGDYYSMLHALDREAAGNNPYSDMTVADMKRIVAEYEKENPDFKAAAEKLSAFNSALLDIEVQAGIRSQENADNLRKKYPHYIPMYVQEDGEIGRAPVRGARNMEVRRDNKAATESNHRVNDAIKNYLNQVERRIRAAKFNLVLQEVYNSADDVNVVKAEDAKATARDLREREKAYLENPETETDPAEMFRKVQKGRQTVNEVSFYMDGKRVTMAVTDRIYTGLSDLAGIHSSILDLGLVKFTAKINSTFKKLVTNWNPFFAVKNIARDLQDGMLQSKFGMGEFIAMYKKNADMMMSGKYNKEWELFLANGCLEASIFSDEFGTVAKSGKSGLEQAVGVAGQFQHIKNFNTLTEALPRFTEFCLTLKHGGTVQQAIYNAADVTVNFGRSGTLIRILNSTVSPFLNPAVQGLDRVIRLFTEDGIKNNKALASLLLKAVLLAIVPMALGNAMYGDDDEYKDMKDSIKENNYLFKVGDTWLKLPRGRVVSTISGLFNRSYKQLTGQETDWGDYGKNVLEQITPAQNVARHIGSPFYDVANNRTWYGTKIESDALQNYAVKDRYDENTSRLAVWIGQFTSHFGYSPKEVHYLIDQYTGVIGDILLPSTTPAGTKGVVSYNFTIDPNTSSNLSTRFYDLYNNTMYKSNAGDEEAYYLKKRLDETKSAVNDLYKEIKTINASTELSNKEKVKQASAVRAIINQLYKTALDDRRLYAQNIKDALAIENSYAVEKITAKSAKQYGLDGSSVGKYAVTFGGQFVKQYATEDQATGYMTDTAKKTVYAEANRLTYGAEYALKEYSSTVYDKAANLNELGISWDEYYNYYMTVRYYSGSEKKNKILSYLKAEGMTQNQVALMMYYSGYSSYADEAKKAIKASSLSAERKKELLAGITN